MITYIITTTFVEVGSILYALERAICISKNNQKITNLRYLICVVGFSIRKESKKMSRIKRYAEELYGEDWVHKLEDKENEESRKQRA